MPDGTDRRPWERTFLVISCFRRQRSLCIRYGVAEKLQSTKISAIGGWPRLTAEPGVVTFIRRYWNGKRYWLRLICMLGIGAVAGRDLGGRCPRMLRLRSQIWKPDESN